MAPPFRTATRDHQLKPAAPEDLPRLVAALQPTERMVLRLKALIGQATNKGEFLTIMNATGTRGPDGRPWSAQTVNGALDRLVAMGLIDGEYACYPALWHPLAVEAAKAPEGPAMIQAALGCLPESSRDRWGSYSIQTDTSVLRRLRLSVYANDRESYGQLLGGYMRWTPLSGQQWGGVKRESRRVPVRRSAKRLEQVVRLPFFFPLSNQNLLFVVEPVGMWAKVSISPCSPALNSPRVQC